MWPTDLSSPVSSMISRTSSSSSSSYRHASVNGLSVSLRPSLPCSSQAAASSVYNQPDQCSSAPSADSSSSLDSRADDILRRDLAALAQHVSPPRGTPTTSLTSISPTPLGAPHHSNASNQHHHAPHHNKARKRGRTSSSASSSLSLSNDILEKELKKHKHREIDAARRARETTAVSRLSQLITKVEESSILEAVAQTTSHCSSSSSSTSVITHQPSSSNSDKKDKLGILEVAADKLVELESLCSLLTKGLQSEKEKNTTLEALLRPPLHSSRRILRSSYRRQQQQQQLDRMAT